MDLTKGMIVVAKVVGQRAMMLLCNSSAAAGSGRLQPAIAVWKVGTGHGRCPFKRFPASFGIRLGKVGRGAFALAVRPAVADDPLSSERMDAMLSARAALWKQYCRLHDLVVKTVARSEPCRRFMAIPGVGPVTALSFMTAIDDPPRFRRSRDVAAYFGLTSRRSQAPRSTFRAASPR